MKGTMSQRRPNVWELVVNLGREVRPALRSIRTKTGTNRPIDEGAGDSPAPLINDN